MTPHRTFFSSSATRLALVGGLTLAGSLVFWAKKMQPEWRALETSFQQRIGIEQRPSVLNTVTHESATPTLSRRNTKNKALEQKQKPENNVVKTEPIGVTHKALEQNENQTEKTIAVAKKETVEQSKKEVKTEPEPIGVTRKALERSENQTENTIAVAKKGTVEQSKEEVVTSKSAPKASVLLQKEVVAPISRSPAPTVVERKVGSKDKRVEKEPQVIRKKSVDSEKDIVQVKNRESAKWDNVLEHDMERTALEGLEKLDENSLRVRVIQLATEMKNRAKWQAFELAESLDTLEVELQKKHDVQLRRQLESNTELLQEQLQVQEERLKHEFSQELEQVKQSARDSVARKVSEQIKVCQKDYKEKLQQHVLRIQHESAEKFGEEVQVIRAQAQRESAERLGVLNDLQLSVEVLEQVLHAMSDDQTFSHQVHQVSTAVMALDDWEAPNPLFKELEALRVAARGDELLLAVLSALPPSISNQGTPTLEHLQATFGRVRRAGRHVAMTPENSGRLGSFLGLVLASLSLKPVGPVPGTDPEAIFSRAESALGVGNVRAAIQELEKLNGPVAEVVSEWIREAKSRLVTQQAMNVVKAHVSILATSCS